MGEKTAATLDISTYTVWRMRMKLLHMFEELLNTTVVSGEIELDEKYLYLTIQFRHSL